MSVLGLALKYGYRTPLAQGIEQRFQLRVRGSNPSRARSQPLALKVEAALQRTSTAGLCQVCLQPSEHGLRFGVSKLKGRAVYHV